MFRGFLDVYAKGSGEVFNVEMQVNNQHNISKRMRKYLSSLDLHNLNAGEDYNTLPDTYLIFICHFDPYQRDLPRYDFEDRCIQALDLSINDGVRKIILNPKAKDKEQNPEMRNFLYYSLIKIAMYPMAIFVSNKAEES